MNKLEKAKVAVEALEASCHMANQIGAILNAANRIEDQQLRLEVKGDIAMGMISFLEDFDSYTKVERMIRQLKQEDMEDVF